MPDDLTLRLSRHLKDLRRSRGWSLDQLATASGISRATLSRLENAEVSPTAENLGRLCAAHGLPMSRLLMAVEDSFSPGIPRDRQTVWADPATGFTRRSVSPPDPGLAAEVLDCQMPPETRITYDAPPRPGQEHHLILLEGSLTLTLDGTSHELTTGDCLRYHLSGSSIFETGSAQGARYLLVLS